MKILSFTVETLVNRTFVFSRCWQYGSSSFNQHWFVNASVWTSKSV